MKYIYVFIFLFISSYVFAFQNLESKSAKASFEVSGVCDMCKSRIENGAIKLKGVKYAKWDIPSNNLSIIYNSKKIKLDSIKKNIAELGHDTDKYKARLEVYESLPVCCNYKTNSPH
jgi:copper chaperone CopZ|tara:strand:- start:3016 stop:3366 length:351 start_codon:yes stop_codon:yes gene_type:complete